MSDLDKIAARPSYCGQTAEALRASARMTADAWGRAYIVVTRSVADSHAGGRVYVSREPNPAWCAPTVILETVEA